jgi:hypothetical protein
LEKQSLSLKFEPILLSFFWQFIHDNLFKFNNEIEPSRWPINRGRQSAFLLHKLATPTFGFKCQ